VYPTARNVSNEKDSSSLNMNRMSISSYTISN
jgi:hypothetical protein